jgi:hypothetical protein
MSPSLLDILIRPDAFFSNLKTEKESLKIPILIVLIGAIVGAMTAYVSSSPTSQMMDGISPGLGALTVVVALIAGFISAFVFWILWAEVIFITSMILRKELISGFNRELIGTVIGLTGIFLFLILSIMQQNMATTSDSSSILISLLSLFAMVEIIVSFFIFLSIERFKRPLEFVGYGYLPQIIGSFISLVVAIEYIPRITITAISSTALQDPVVLQQSMKAFMHNPVMVELTQITSLITIVFLLWSANVWIFGAKHTYNLSPRDAAICVGVPVVLYVLYTIYNLGVM